MFGLKQSPLGSDFAASVRELLFLMGLLSSKNGTVFRPQPRLPGGIFQPKPVLFQILLEIQAVTGNTEIQNRWMELFSNDFG